MILAAVAILALIGVAPAQTILWEQVGVDPTLWRGGPSVFLGDTNGDGYGDWANIVGVFPPVGASMTLVLSGRDGSTLRTNTFGGPLSSAGDWDGDGCLDYVTRGPGGMLVVSGRDDRVLQVFAGSGQPFSNFGTYVAGNLDVDGDGRLDLVIGDPAGGIQQVFVYDHDGGLIHTIDVGHGSLGALPDIDGDGCDEFLVGTDDVEQHGEVQVYSGRTGVLISRANGERPFDGIGLGEIVSVGDVNGDGLADFAASSDGSLFRAGLVRVFAGTLAPRNPVIFTFRRGPGTMFGRALAVGDLDLDGMPDLLVGSAEFVGTTGGTVYWYSLRDGSLVRKMLPLGFNPRSSQFGKYVVIGEPHPDNPFPVFLTGEELWNPFALIYPALGRTTLFRSAPASVGGLGPACAGTLDEAPLMGLTARPSHPVRIHLSGAPSGAQALLLLGVSSANWNGVPLPISLTSPFGLPGCQLYTSIELVAAVQTGTSGNDAGYAFVDVPLPIATGTPQVTVHGQWMVMDTSGVGPAAMSNSLTWGH